MYLYRTNRLKLSERALEELRGPVQGFVEACMAKQRIKGNE